MPPHKVCTYQHDFNMFFLHDNWSQGVAHSNYDQIALETEVNMQHVSACF